MQVGDTITVKTWRHARHKCTCGNVHDGVVIDGVYRVTVTEEVYRAAVMGIGEQHPSFEGIDEDGNTWHIGYDYVEGRGYIFTAMIDGRAVWADRHLPRYWNYIEAADEYRHV